MSKAGKKRKAPPGGLPELAKALVAEPEAKANNLPRLLAALKPGCAEVRMAATMHAGWQRRPGRRSAAAACRPAQRPAHSCSTH